MGFVQELADFISKFSFYKVVYEFEQGLHFRGGKVIERRVKNIKKEALEEILKGEKEVAEKAVGDNVFLGLLYYTVPFVRPKIPDDFERSIVSGIPYHKKGDMEKDKELLRKTIIENKLLKTLYFLIYPAKNLPEGYRKSWRGEPLHSKRFSKILQPGFYLYVPFLDTIVTDSAQERVLNLGYISVLTHEKRDGKNNKTEKDLIYESNSIHPTSRKGSKNVIISCKIRYELMDIYRAYTAIDEYEDSLKDHTLSILAEFSRGKDYDYWTNSENIDNLAKDVEKELRKIATEKWGLKIHKIYITDIAFCEVQRTVHEGLAGIIKAPQQPISQTSEMQPTS
ncbi:MAG: hypothetical protein N3D84_03805 [Candidatus Woesearchaeota archaeon]|nr:hypothetical protein [Candidatus Woesearchaeota archaeon]